ncbi:hypothetical protein R3W88_025499 [Solanum pinnatisectum]|uniref:Agenet domain-containing protein n=1 Tax=Solanum pinnatisectum TaxID=50273 RepID=A0AAV9M3U7_9SOLN|nr:hypothetical protein R3W88_025499 [Solanum pinnatisectum]
MGQLMLRPEYPPVHLKNKVSDVSSNSDVTVVVGGTWREGDLVDWLYDDCYWSGQVTKSLDNGKAKIELLPPPLGEGETYDAFVKDLRPSLDWSLECGWVMPASQAGESSRQYPQLLKLVSQGHAIVKGRRGRQARTESSSNSSFYTRLSGYLQRDVTTSKDAANRSNDMFKETASYASSFAHSSAKSLPALDDKRGSESKELLDQFSNIAELKEAASISPIRVDASKSVGPTDMDQKVLGLLDKFKTSGDIPFNSLESDELEEAILDLEELANKISRLKQLMESKRPLPDGVTPSWKFVKHQVTSTKN